MAIRDFFSFRKRLAQGKTPDVYRYDELPIELRVQIIHIWREALGSWNLNEEGWATVHKAVAREHGVFQLSHGQWDGEHCDNFLLKESSVNRVLDLVEASFQYIDSVARRFPDYEWPRYGIQVRASDAIAELNERFRRAGVGYRFERGMIIRVDSELIHSEIVKPALAYLSQRGFEGPRDEFLSAHAHYRAGENKDAITDANNAFESTLKAVCDHRKWSYPRGARASDLLKTVRQNGLLPGYLDNSFDQLAATLHSGLPQVRNSEGGHGQGAMPRETPDYVAGYALHLAAASILLIVEAHKAMG
ncbi:MAG: hypothetical protein OXK81_08850 [Chloroflexota bacterium]|nr:hypothetical protein [Chloroflexota bacterium]